MIAAIKNGNETKVQELLDDDEDLLTYGYDYVRRSVMSTYFILTNYFNFE